VQGRDHDAVLAFRRAETIHPYRVQRDPFAREVLAELLTRSRRGAVDRELRGTRTPRRRHTTWRSENGRVEGPLGPS